MCHLILAMPILALPIFWLMPPNFAIPIYAVIAITSGLLYWMITKAMRNPVGTGVESLPGTIAEVVAMSNQPGPPKYMVRARGELWTAKCDSSLHLGEEVTVIAVDGLKLVIKAAGNETRDIEKKE